MLRQWANNVPNPSQVGNGYITSALSESEKKMIVITLEESAKRVWSCGPKELKLMVQSFLNKVERKSKLNDNLPGEDYMINFKKSNHQLCCRKPEVMIKARVASFSVQTLDKYFKLLLQVHFENGLLGTKEASKRISERHQQDASERGIREDIRERHQRETSERDIRERHQRQASERISERGIRERHQREASERGIRERHQREASERGIRVQHQRVALERGIRERHL